jgi:hypothetical protein
VAGLVMFGAFLRDLQVDHRLRELFGHLKSSKGVVYPMHAQLRLLLDTFVAGEQRVFGLENLAADALFVLLAGGVVPSIDTVYRDLDRFDPKSVDALTAVMVEHGLVPVRRMGKLTEAHVDIDTTVMPIFGELEGAVPGPNPHYHGRPSYHPVLARVAETDTCVGAMLRTGDTSFGAAEAPFVEITLDSVREAIGPDCLLYVRIDAAGDCTDIMQTIHRKGALFVTKGKMTPDLCAAVAAHSRWTTTDRDADGLATRQVAVIAFRRQQWDTAWDVPVRVIAVRSRERDNGKQLYLWEGLDFTVQVYLSNDWISDADDVAWRYDKRGGIEPLIAEFKNGWGIGKMSTDGFTANAATLMLKLLAHNLLRRYVNEKIPALKSWRSAWIRRTVILVPGRIARSGRRKTLHMPSRPVLERMLD